MYIKIEKILFVIKFWFVFLIVISNNTFGWWSAPFPTPFDPSTHFSLSQNVIDSVAVECPDMGPNYFGNDVRNITSGVLDDTKSHGGNAQANDGPALQFWTDALLEYKNFNFLGVETPITKEGAYLKIGRVVHLTEDMSVPAHVINILHGIELFHPPWLTDNFEANASGNYSLIGVIPVRLIDPKDPLEVKKANYDNTFAIVTNAPWTQYWQVGDPNGQYTGGTDTFPRNLGENAAADALVALQLANARNYAAGALIAMSKSLPPLIKDFEIEHLYSIPAVITPNMSGKISFKVYENRKDTVTIFMTIDNAKGEAIMDPSYGTGKSETLKSGTVLPWEDSFSYTWDGKLANGQYPSNGLHTLYMHVVDFDGNDSTVATHDFFYGTPQVLTCLPYGNYTSYPNTMTVGFDRPMDTHSPSITIDKNANLLYQQWIANNEAVSASITGLADDETYTITVP